MRQENPYCVRECVASSTFCTQGTTSSNKACERCTELSAHDREAGPARSESGHGLTSPTRIQNLQQHGWHSTSMPYAINRALLFETGPLVSGVLLGQQKEGCCLQGARSTRVCLEGVGGGWRSRGSAGRRTGRKGRRGTIRALQQGNKSSGIQQSQAPGGGGGNRVGGVPVVAQRKL